MKEEVEQLVGTVEVLEWGVGGVVWDLVGVVLGIVAVFFRALREPRRQGSIVSNPAGGPRA